MAVRIFASVRQSKAKGKKAKKTVSPAKIKPKAGGFEPFEPHQAIVEHNGDMLKYLAGIYIYIRWFTWIILLDVSD